MTVPTPDPATAKLPAPDARAVAAFRPISDDLRAQLDAPRQDATWIPAADTLHEVAEAARELLATAEGMAYHGVIGGLFALTQALDRAALAAGEPAVRERDGQASEPDHRCAELDCGRRCMLPNDGHQDGDHLFWPAVPPATDGEPREDEARDTDSISDGHHTFGELYDHRRALTAALARQMPDRSWRSKAHHPDGDPMFEGGYFIVGIDLPDQGPVTYHYSLDHWDDFTQVREVPFAPLWDGALPDDTITRLLTFAAAPVRPPVTPAGDAETLRAAVRRLHQPIMKRLPTGLNSITDCQECGHPWPCPTLSALVAAPAAERAEDGEPR